MGKSEDSSGARGPALATVSLGGGGDGEPGFAGGDLIGDRYRVVRLLGHGGMGEVYEVEDQVLGGRVALKTMRSHRWRDAREVARIKREMQLARRITHPGICRIFDLGTHRGGALRLPFITMELVLGETLAQRIKRDGRLPLPQGLPLAEQLATALTAAHDAGVIHCDLKSSNILLRAGGRAVITDFGLARLSAGGATDSPRLGTPAYMAPEQVKGGAITAATDVYALGVVLYEMLTGRLPFLESTARATALCRLEAPPPPPRLHAPDLDPRAEAAILRCLEIDPRRRFPSAAAAVAALRPPAGRRGLLLAALAGTVLVAAGAIALLPIAGRQAAIAATRAVGCGYDGPVIVDEYRDRAAFEKAAGAHRVIGFDDVDSGRGPVSIAADRYAASHGVILRGTDGQWVDRSFGYPDDFRSVSAPNGFAPGPRAAPDSPVAAGGHDTDVSFRAGRAEACVSAVGAMFEDADYDFPGEPTGMAIFDRGGNPLGKVRARLAGNGAAQFLGLIAHTPEGGPATVIFRARVVNGNTWPMVENGEGVVLDDLELGTPRAR